jgi:hypothetical protein
MEKPKTYTLEKIQKELGAPTELQAKANAPTEPESELTERGRQIASERILTDMERLYGLAYTFWVGATEAQKDALIGFSEGVLRYAVDQALALRGLTSHTSEAGFLDEAELKRRRDAAAMAFSEGITLRDKARNVLKKVAPDEATKQTIEDAVGTAENDESLRAGLDRLAAIGAGLLKTTDEVAKTRLQDARFTEEFPKKLAVAAEKISATSKDAAARSTIKKASQGEIDLLDGVNLALLREIVITFEDAHESDPSVPRLLPIATRRLIGKRRSYDKKTDEKK